MAVSNTTYEQTLGLITAITEVTRNADKAANSLKTISQRLRGVGEDGEDATEYVGKLQDEFDKLDINAQIVKSDGSMESTFNILTAISEKWDALTDSEKQALGELAAGKNRITEFNALMSNFDVALSASETAMNSMGSATKENEKYLNSIEGKIQNLNSAWQNFARNTINSEWVKGVVGGLTGVIKSFDNFYQVLVPLAGLIASFKYDSLLKGFNSLKTVGSGVFKTFSNLINVIKLYPSAAIDAAVNNISLSDSYKALGVNVNFTQLAIGSLTIALTAAILIYNKVKKSQEEYVSSLKEEASENDRFADSLQTTLDKYKELSSSSDTMSEATDTLNSFLEEEGMLYSDLGKKLELEKDDRNKVIDTLKEEIEQRKLLAQAKKEEAYNTEKTGNVDQAWWQQSLSVMTGSDKFDLSNFLGKNKTLDLAGLSDLTTGWNLDFGDLSGQFGASATTLAGLNDELKRNIDLLMQSGDLTDDDKNKLSKYTQAQSTLQSAIDAATEAYSGRFEMLKSGTAIGVGYENVLINLGIATRDEIDFYNSLIGVSDEVREKQIAIYEGTEKASEGFLNLNNIIKESNSVIETNGMSLEDLNSKIDEIQSAYEFMADAVDEYNESGYISMDTLQSLLDLDASYLASLEMVNGQLVLNEASMANLAEAAKVAAISELQDAAAKDLNALAAGNVNAMSDLAKSAIAGVGDNSETAAGKMDTATTAALKLATGLRAVAEAGGQYTSTENYAEKANAIINSYSNIANTISNLKISTGASSGRKSGGGSKSSSKSTKDTWKEEFEEQYAILKHQLAMDEITEKQYTDRLEKLYKKYFGNKKKYASEYNKYEEEVYKNRKKLLEEEIDEMEKVLKKQRELAENKYENAIKVATNAIDEQIEVLQKQKEALEENNDETERAIELAKLQEALEKAKSQKTMRVFYADRGWVYEADQQAIKDARDALDEFQAESAKQAQEEALDAQIEELKQLKDAWSDIASNYEMQQNKLQAAMDFGADFEKTILSERLDYLKTFVKEYNAQMDKLSADEQKLVKYAASVGIDISDKYASGTTSAKGGLSLVGENGAELRVLNKGDGIIPAQLTENLMKWGSFDPTNYFKEMMNNKFTPAIAGTNSSSSTVYNLSNFTINSNANSLDELIRDIQIKIKNR